MKEETMRLNPFVYISETDVRFYLLVTIGIMVPYSQATTLSVIPIVMGMGYGIFIRLLIMVPIFSFIPLLIYWNYKRFPKKIAKEAKLKEFDQKKFPDHYEYIEKLYKKYLSTVKQPTLMYQPSDPLNPSESASAFGTKNHMYIDIPAGLIRKFRKNIDGFRSIFLHEIGHIANRDVGKAYLAASTWRSLQLTLSIPFGIVLLFLIYLASKVFYHGILAGYDIGYIISNLSELFIEFSLTLGGIILYFLLFLAIVYVLRNQMIRSREFYADAKVLEWEESPKGIVKTLEEMGGEQYSEFEILRKFHPNINERIQVLKNNSRLFIPGLWVAFAIGFFYARIMVDSVILNIEIFMVPAADAYVLLLISILIFPILMLAVSSSFHKSILKDVFIDNTRYFSIAAILNIMKFSLAFSLGWQTNALIWLPWRTFSLYENAKGWIFNALYFSIVLFFLLIFASMLIRRSFSNKEAKKNFLMITVFSSALYIINRFVAIEILDNKPLIIVFFLIFSVITYIFIKIKDRKLCCPNCNNKISNLSGLKLNCPNCHHNLYSWAIYSFSRST